MTVPLVEEVSPCPDPGDAMSAFADQPGLLLLESALVRDPTGQYSFLAADPFETVLLQRTPFGTDPFERLRRSLRGFESETVTGLPPSRGEPRASCPTSLGEPSRESPAPADEFVMPDMAVGFYDWVVAWDHKQKRAWIISQGLPEARPADRYRRAAERLRFVQARLKSGPQPSSSRPIAHGRLVLPRAIWRDNLKPLDWRISPAIFPVTIT